MTTGEPLNPANATGRANHGKWSALTRRVAYRTGVSSVDALADLANDTQVPPINLRDSRLAYDNQQVAFLRLVSGATAATVQLWINVFDVVAGSTPAGDETDWAFIEEVSITRNTMHKFSGESGGTGIPAGTLKILVTSLTGGNLDIHEQHTKG